MAKNIKGNSSGKGRSYKGNDKGAKYGKGNKQYKQDVEQNSTSGEKMARNSCNDISWYNKYPDLLRAAAEISFNHYPGMDLDVPGVVTKTNGSETAHPFQRRIPGTIAIDFMPSVGRSSNNTSAISLAGKSVFAEVRKAFSGSIAADPPDFMIYIMAMDSVFSYIASLKRLYRCLLVYTPVNMDVPEGLFKAMNLNESSLRYLQANKRALFDAINALIGMTARLFVPDRFSIIDRHRWMNEHIFLDHKSENSQMYVFNQTAFYKYTLDGVGAGMLDMVPKPSFHGVSDPIALMYNYGLDMITRINGSDDAYIISGYLRRAYEGSNFYTIEPLKEDEIQSFIYDEVVLNQIHNSTSCPARINLPSMNVTQDVTTNALIHEPYFDLDDYDDKYGYLTDTALLDLSLVPVGSVAPELAAEVTRLTSIFVPTDSRTVEVHAGTEVVIDYRYINNFYDTDNGSYESEFITTVMKATRESDSELIRLVNRCGFITAFDYAPMTFGVLYLPEYAYEYPAIYINCPYWRTTNVPGEIIRHIHEVCVISQFEAYTF